VPTRPWTLALALALAACGGKPSPPAPEPAKQAREPVRPLVTSPLAGQSVGVIPLTLVISDEVLGQIPPLTNRPAALAWADSMLAAALEGRGPEVKWVLPPELRKIARRSPTVAPDPDRMGQSLLRTQKLQEVPDPLRSSLRSLMALVGGRMVLVPAALAFLKEPGGEVRAELSLVLADTRTGKVVWRTLAWGTGPTLERALVKALDAVLPVGLGLR